MTNFNEWTNEQTSLGKCNLSHLILERVMLVVCERWAGNENRLLYWPQVLLTIAALPSHLGWSRSTVCHWGPKALCLLLALTSAFSLQLTLTICALVILLFNAYLLPLFFRLFTQVHFLIDGSVEGQYIILLLHSLIIWLIVTSLSTDDRHLVFS